MSVYLVPAYGRTYSNPTAAVMAWESGKDFLIEKGPYCSIRDIDALEKDFATIWVRCGPQRETVFNARYPDVMMSFSDSLQSLR